MPNKPIFITGIGTGIGKTLVAAVVVEKLKADYWKPIQSGDLDASDTMKVQSLVSNEKTKSHPEAYRLTQPFSPHKSAKIDGISLNFGKISVPATNNLLVIEGAGGLMVPLNEKQLIIDLIEHLEAEVILVSQNYLGSINHTLLSVELLKQRGIAIKGIIFNGDADASSEVYILNYTGLPLLGRIPNISDISPLSVAEAGSYLNL